MGKHARWSSAALTFAARCVAHDLHLLGSNHFAAPSREVSSRVSKMDDNRLLHAINTEIQGSWPMPMDQSDHRRERTRTVTAGTSNTFDGSRQPSPRRSFSMPLWPCPTCPSAYTMRRVLGV